MDDEELEEHSWNRPQFLSALCTLSFVGSGYTTFQGILSAIQPPEINDDAFKSINDIIKEVPGLVPGLQQSMKDFLVANLFNAAKIGMVHFFVGAMSLFGVVLMYQGQKRGYPVYLLAQVTLIAFDIWLGGYNIAAWSAGFMSLILVGIFAIAYGLQLKHMPR